MIRKERIHDLTPGRRNSGDVVYWMSREQRVSDNPGLLHAIDLAQQRDAGLQVVFALTDEFPGAVLRHYDFMLNGLSEVAAGLAKKKIPFSILRGEPSRVIAEFIRNNETGTVVTDFDPLRVKQRWIADAIAAVDAGFIEVDGHNIVPARFVSNKVEYGAYTLRPKINRHLRDFLEDFPEPEWRGSKPASEPASGDIPHVTGIPDFSVPEVLDGLDLDRSVPPVDWIRPGERAAREMLAEFITKRLPGYDTGRNDPNVHAHSDLSPYLHFGQVSSLRVALEMMREAPDDEHRAAFLEELIIRKELSDNFCLYNPEYDTPDGFHEWAQKTIAAHADDEREYLYTAEAFEQGETHDPLWNAAQMEMVKTGKMHGYMRMYWAKKILEWTPGVDEAMESAIWLNDKYSLDGRDPNGYTGVAWSVGGVHDRAWQERPVFGKIRYMNANGARRKFDTEAYIKHIKTL